MNEMTNFTRNGSYAIKNATQLRNNVAIVGKMRRDQEALKSILMRNGFHVEQFGSAEELGKGEGLEVCDVMIFNAPLPDADGLALLRWTVANATDVGILVRSETDDEIERIVALELGADDCVPRSCNPREMAARVRAMARRRQNIETHIEAKSETNGVPDTDLAYSGWILPAGGRRLFTPNANEIRITNPEFLILRHLFSNPTAIMERSEIRELTARNGEVQDLRSVDVRVSRMRRKLTRYGDRNVIETIRNVGYGLLQSS